MEKTDRELLIEANNIIRSFHSVIERKGATTNWEGLEITVNRILKEQHKVLYPKLKDIRQMKLNRINEQNSE